MFFTLIFENANGDQVDFLDCGGVKTNIINRLISGFTWLSLREGKNLLEERYEYLRFIGSSNGSVSRHLFIRI